MGNSIRIDNGIKRIEVNDDGDVILLRLGDNSFIRDFYKLADSFQERAEAVKVDDTDITDSMEQVVSLEISMKEEVDKRFGDGTCNTNLQ